MELGMQVGLGPGHTVLDGDPAPPTDRGTATPHIEISRRRFCLSPYNPRSTSIIPKRLYDQDETWHGGRPWPSLNCIKWGPSSLPPKRAQPPSHQKNSVMSVVVKRLDGSRCHLVGR